MPKSLVAEASYTLGFGGATIICCGDLVLLVCARCTVSVVSISIWLLFYVVAEFILCKGSVFCSTAFVYSSAASLPMKLFYCGLYNGVLLSAVWLVSFSPCFGYSPWAVSLSWLFSSSFSLKLSTTLLFASVTSSAPSFPFYPCCCSCFRRSLLP
jgi:hypothetical protein